MNFLIDPNCEGTIEYARLQDDLHRGFAVAKFDRPVEQLYCRLFGWLVQIYNQLPEVKAISEDSSSVTRNTAEATKVSFDNPPSTDREIESDSANPEISTVELPLEPSWLSAWRDSFQRSNSQIIIETSGSSGRPKQVVHSVESLTKGIKLDAKHRTDIWGLTYPLNHLAGLQVLFQAILNLNPIVNLYQLPAAQVHQAIDLHRITHLSSTPTFLRMLAANRQTHTSVVRITCGGERLDASLVQLAHDLFPNARLTNIYAATETGTLLVSHNDQFVVPQELIPKFKVIEGELWLHESLKVNARQVQQPEIRQPTSLDSFWNTGDLVEVLVEEPLTIRFTGRRHEWFNVAGFRVDPVRLETIAAEFPGVVQARFFGIPNSITENLVACDLVLTSAPTETDFNEEAWKKWFSQRVERHEVPRFVKLVSAVPISESGKMKRRDS